MYARLGGRAYFLFNLIGGPSPTGLRTLIEWGSPTNETYYAITGSPLQTNRVAYQAAFSRNQSYRPLFKT